MEMVTIPVALYDEFSFYMHHSLKIWFFEKIFELVYLFHTYSLKITYILLRQVISLKKIVVLSVNFITLILWSLFPLILLSALMKMASTTATILCNSMKCRHPWRRNIWIKGSDRRPFILKFIVILL